MENQVYDPKKNQNTVGSNCSGPCAVLILEVDHNFERQLASITELSYLALLLDSHNELEVKNSVYKWWCHTKAVLMRL